jgi:hypothetical protein
MIAASAKQRLESVTVRRTPQSRASDGLADPSGLPGRGRLAAANVAFAIGVTEPRNPWAGRHVINGVALARVRRLPDG